MKKTLHLCLVIVNLALLTTADSQLFKINLDEKVRNSSLIAEGRVIAKKSFWNDAHTMIYTTNTVRVYKTFKGKTAASTIEVVTQGGFVGTQGVEVSELLSLENNQVGVFFCFENAVNLKSPVTKQTLYDVYSSDQGFLRYDLVRNRAYAPFASYNNIESSLYSEIQRQTGEAMQVTDASFSIAQTVKQNNDYSSNGVAGTLATITSFSPLTVHGGALNDPTNNVLTILGTGFNDAPSGSAAVNFKDGNSDNITPDYPVAYNSPYIISWTDTKIVVRVPGHAATGKISVSQKNGTAVESFGQLNVYFSVLSFAFDSSNFKFKASAAVEPRLMNTNGQGGYTYQFSTSTAGKGINFAKDADAKGAFTRAVNTWQEIVGANLTLGANTTTQAIGNDGINLIEYDNLNTKVLPMGAGVLEVTYSYPSFCYIKTPFKVFAAQKVGFDILLRNPDPSVSKGGVIDFEKGPCFPAIGSYDMENVILHELGHALNLAHINDGYEASSAGYTHLNPGKIMHYAILDYVDRRSPDNSAYQGALYAINPQHNIYGSCGLSTEEMVPLDYTPLANDECPGSFPATATNTGTQVNFDLVHATSNKLKDPAFTQVNGQNSGVQVTNNAWYVLKTAGTGNSTLSLNITNYLTSPVEEAACTGQGIQMAIYELSACPVGQSFPQPKAYVTFTGNGSLPNIGGLAANTTYVLYFDGLRNTKATFTVTLNGSALPIILSSFTGEYIHGVDNLYINIEQAADVKNVIIEKSADGSNFSQLGALQVQPSQLAGKHTYADAQPFAGNNYYRLKVVDNDGKYQYSNVVLLKNSVSSLIYVYPNPAKNNVSVNFSGISAGQYNFRVYNIEGKAVYSNLHTLTTGNETVNLPLTGMASGTYILKITNSAGKTISQQKLVKQ